MEAKTASPIEIRILGQRIPLRSSASEPQRAQEIVDLVTRRIIDAESRAHPGSQPQHVAVLALLELAEDYLRAKRSFESHQNEIETRAQELISLLGPE